MSIIIIIVLRIIGRMGMSPILSGIHTAIVGTILNNNDGDNGHGLKTLCVNRP